MMTTTKTGDAKFILGRGEHLTDTGNGRMEATHFFFTVCEYATLEVVACAMMCADAQALVDSFNAAA